MASFFTPNPAFWPEIEHAIAEAESDLLEDAAQIARGRARPEVAEAIAIEPAKHDGTDVVGAIHLTTMLARAFEKGTEERFTRSGASRGRITAEPVLQDAVDTAATRGLLLSRYL